MFIVVWFCAYLLNPKLLYYLAPKAKPVVDCLAVKDKPAEAGVYDIIIPLFGASLFAPDLPDLKLAPIFLANSGLLPTS